MIEFVIAHPTFFVLTPFKLYFLLTILWFILPWVLNWKGFIGKGNRVDNPYLGILGIFICLPIIVISLIFIGISRLLHLTDWIVNKTTFELLKSIRLQVDKEK